VLLSATNPEFLERRFDQTPSLFPDDHTRSDWKERIYVVVAPRGHRVTGLDVAVTGQLLRRRPYHSYAMRILPFPLPRDFERHYLGAIFGQTEDTRTLKKSVDFQGTHRQVFAVQFVESRSRIDSWRIDARIESNKIVESAPPVTEVADGDEFWEGRPLATLELPTEDSSGASRTSSQLYYQSKKECDIVHTPKVGYLLTTTRGEFDGRELDLWVYRSANGRQWERVEASALNSSSEEFNPRWTRTESGDACLAWISTRRGKGWEPWLSQTRDGNVFSTPRRVPAEKFVETGLEHSRDLNTLLEYDLCQDGLGR
jgi:hypothetical protein